VAHSAGLRTADYLLAHRIPKPVQALLKRLPATWAARLLLSAIRRHAWTFAGSGVFTARAGRPTVLTLRSNPLCKGVASAVPACDFYAATFERLFRTLVHRDARAVEVACEACGDAECRFELRW
jgi:divinyl protochlorophyllide a 8-vinyl-reductase